MYRANLFNKVVFVLVSEDLNVSHSVFQRADGNLLFFPHKCKLSVSFLLDIPAMNNISKEGIVNVHHVILMRKINMLKLELYHCGSVYMTINDLSPFFIRAQFIIIHVRCCG